MQQSNVAAQQWFLQLALQYLSTRSYGMASHGFPSPPAVQSSPRVNRKVRGPALFFLARRSLRLAGALLRQAMRRRPDRAGARRGAGAAGTGAPGRSAIDRSFGQ